MRYTIYKTINTTNGKYYIGKHQTLNPHDSYMGSGKALREAIKIYGKCAFIKEVLYDFDTEEEMNAMEIAIVTEKFISSHDCYNMAVGGEGGAHFKGRKHSEETRKKLKEISRNRLPTTDETRQKISEANRRRGSPSEETRRKIAQKAIERGPRTEEQKRKISETLSARGKSLRHSEETKEKISKARREYERKRLLTQD